MTDVLQAYCVKCKTKREMSNPQATFTSLGAPITMGTCPVCGTRLARMGATPAHAGLVKPEPTPRAATTKAAAPAKSKRTTAGKTAKSAKTTRAGAKTSATTTRKTAAKSAKPAAKSARGAASNSDDSGSRKTIGKLVIVESPAKARSVGNYLGKGYTVKASKGHVRDLLVSQLSVDVENDFEPKYRVMNDKRDVVSDLKSAVDRATEIYLATDPDREGEAIAWHLLAATELGKDDKRPIRRVVFHEITEPAIKEAFGHPREIDLNLVNAYQARRILDRLVGYNITELLWEKVRNRLSAGRVQSIAVRIIVDREREIEAFIPREYWTLDARLRKQQKNGQADTRPFLSRLVKINGADVEFGSEGDVTPHVERLKRADYTVAEVKRGERQRKPSAPFTTSTLQQEASRRLGFTARRTMAVAQQLYEGIEIGGEGITGLITYMRTDSTAVSPQAAAETREFVEQRYGKTFLPATAPIYKTRAKGAQEAHEAIRPTRILRDPESMKPYLERDQLKLYGLIWQRFVASQMAPAIYNTLRVDISATLADGTTPSYEFRVSGSTIKFQGFLVLYEDARDEDMALDEDEGRILPDFVAGERLDLLELLPEQHFTQPPPRYTEATLVRTLEEYGIGRPSTYAPTVAVIQDREYVTKEDKRLTPTPTGKIVTDLLTQHFPDIMDFTFTERMEDQLDEISEGQLEWRPMLGDFYTPFQRELQTARDTLPRLQQEEPVGRDCVVCGKPLVIRYGRFGKFIGCSDYPTCRHTEPFLDRMGIACPICGKIHGGEIVERKTRKGRTFFGCSRYPECEFTSWKRPIAQPCANCGGLVVEQSRSSAQCTVCSTVYPTRKVSEAEAEPA